MLLLLPALIGCRVDPDMSASSASDLARQQRALMPANSASEPTALPPEFADLASVEGVLFGPYFDADGDRAVWVRRAPRAQWAELVKAERVEARWVVDVLVGGSANPDRPAISEDGRTVAFVAGLTGISSVWTLPFDGAHDPVQHTNVGLHLVKRLPGQAPPGFVPPPITGTLAFSGDLLSWKGPSGTHAVRWR